MFPDCFPSGDLLEPFNPRHDTVVWKRFRGLMKSFFVKHMKISHTSIFDVFKKSPFPFELPPVMGERYAGIVDESLYETYDDSDAELSDMVLASCLHFCIPAFIWAYNGLKKEVLQLNEIITRTFEDLQKFRAMTNLPDPDERKLLDAAKIDHNVLSSKVKPGTAYNFWRQQDLTDHVVDMEFSSDEERAHPTAKHCRPSFEKLYHPPQVLDTSFNSLRHEFDQHRRRIGKHLAMLQEKRAKVANSSSGESDTEWDNDVEEHIFDRDVTPLGTHHGRILFLNYM